MLLQLNRRQFISRATVAGAGAMLTGLRAPAANFRGRIRKAKIVGEVTEQTLEPLKAATFRWRRNHSHLPGRGSGQRASSRRKAWDESPFGSARMDGVQQRRP